MTAGPTSDRRPVRIANCSGFYGDRLAAAREMVEGGPIDVLTGDYLAELTMLILWKARQKDPDAGFARTFLTQLEEVLGTCLDHGIRVVSNAGGLAPAGLAAQVGQLAERLGLHPRVAYVHGDDLLPRVPELLADGVDLAHLDTGQRLGDAGVNPVSANAYLGGWGIAEALAAGADVVLALGGYAGFHTTTPPSAASAYGVYWPALVSRDRVEHVVVLPDGTSRVVEHPPSGPLPMVPPADAAGGATDEPTERVPLGRLVGARSGDKGGNANVGLWARDDATWEWLAGTLTVERFRELLPEAVDLAVRRYELPRLRALNLVVVGLLGEGVASATRSDPQAKGLGEYLRSRTVEVPVRLLR